MLSPQPLSLCPWSLPHLPFPFSSHVLGGCDMKEGWDLGTVEDLSRHSFSQDKTSMLTSLTDEE